MAQVSLERAAGLALESLEARTQLARLLRGHHAHWENAPVAPIAVHLLLAQDFRHVGLLQALPAITFITSGG